LKLSSVICHNPALLPDNPTLFGNNGRLFCGGNYFKKNMKKVAKIFGGLQIIL
jgi:hypothetical protein